VEVEPPSLPAPTPAPPQPSPNRPPATPLAFDFQPLIGHIGSAVEEINEQTRQDNEKRQKKYGEDAIEEPLSSADIIKDARGRDILRLTQGAGPGRAYVSDIRFDKQTGAIAVSSPNNPGGAFFLTDRITNMAPLMDRQYENADAFIQGAREAGVYQNKAGFIMQAIWGKNSLLTAARVASKGEGEGDQSSYQSIMPNELSGHARVRWANAITLPTTVQEKGAKPPTHMSHKDWSDFLDRSNG